MPVPPLLWKTCFIQKQAVELLSRPSSARWSSSLASVGSLITGAAVEHLAAAVQHEVVVRGDVGEDDRQRGAVASSDVTIDTHTTSGRSTSVIGLPNVMRCDKRRR